MKLAGACNLCDVLEKIMEIRYQFFVFVYDDEFCVKVMSDESCGIEHFVIYISTHAYLSCGLDSLQGWESESESRVGLSEGCLEQIIIHKS